MRANNLTLQWNKTTNGYGGTVFWFEYRGYILHTSSIEQEEEHFVTISVKTSEFTAEKFKGAIEIDSVSVKSLDGCINKADKVIDEVEQWNPLRHGWQLDPHDGWINDQHKGLEFHTEPKISGSRRWIIVKFPIGQHSFEKLKARFPREWGLEKVANTSIKELFPGWNCYYSHGEAFISKNNWPGLRIYPYFNRSYDDYGLMKLYTPAKQNPSLLIECNVAFKDYDKIAPLMIRPKGWSKAWSKALSQGRAYIRVKDNWDGEKYVGRIVGEIKLLHTKYTCSLPLEAGTQAMGDYLKSKEALDECKKLEREYLQEQLKNL